MTSRDGGGTPNPVEGDVARTMVEMASSGGGTTSRPSKKEEDKEEEKRETDVHGILHPPVKEKKKRVRFQEERACKKTKDAFANMCEPRGSTKKRKSMKEKEGQEVTEHEVVVQTPKNKKARSTVEHAAASDDIATFVIPVEDLKLLSTSRATFECQERGGLEMDDNWLAAPKKELDGNWSAPGCGWKGKQHLKMRSLQAICYHIMRKGLISLGKFEPRLHFPIVAVAAGLHPGPEEGEKLDDGEVMGCLKTWFPKEDMDLVREACGAIGMALGVVPKARKEDRQRAIVAAADFVNEQLAKKIILDQEMASLEYQNKKDEILGGPALLELKQNKIKSLVEDCFPQTTNNELLGSGDMLALLDDVILQYKKKQISQTTK